MSRFASHRDAIAVIAALVLPVGVAALLVPFRASFANSAAALILAGVVVAVASNGSRLAGLIAAVSASIWFDFFLTRPYERFSITTRSDIETAISLVAVGIAVTELAVRNRRHGAIAVEESDYVGIVYYLSELVAQGMSSEQIIERATAELIDLLHLRACFFDASPAALEITQIEHDGRVLVGSVEWDVAQSGLPGKEIELHVDGRGETLGRFVLTPTPGWPISVQRRVVAAAIADQVGASLVPDRRSA